MVLYIKTPPGEAELREIVDGLDGAVEDLVRKDSLFKKKELNADDYVGNPDAVVAILLKHKQLLQRPVLVKDGKAVIGRPKAKIVEFLGG